MSLAARVGQALTIAIIIVAAVWAVIAAVIERRRVRVLRAQLLAQEASQALEELEAPELDDLDAPEAGQVASLHLDPLESYRSTPLL